MSVSQSVTVLGGGIAGLSSSFYLAARNNIPKVILYEASKQLGGWINSEVHDGYYFETSARTLRPKGITGNTTLELIQMLGLEGEVVPITSDRVAGKFRLTWSNNRFNTVTKEIDNDLKRLFSSEPSDCESIYDFTVKRFSRELADNVICPMVAGINGGCAKDISASFLVKGKASTPFEQVELFKKAREENWSFYSFKKGIETLTTATADNLSGNDKVCLKTSSKCSEIKFSEGGGAELKINNEIVKTCHIISALPSYSLASLIYAQHPVLAEELQGISYVDVATVNLHFPSNNLLKHKEFGVFVPPSKGSRLIGITFDSHCFDMRGTTLTVILKLEKHDVDDLPAEALKYVIEILGISEKPNKVKSNILRKSFPQYTVGHYARLQRIKDYIKANKLPLSLCGQSYEGIGINEVIMSAKNSANSVEI